MIDNAHQKLDNNLTDDVLIRGKNGANMNSVLSEFSSLDTPEEIVSLLNKDPELIPQLLKSCDSCPALFQTLYPILFSLIHHNSEDSLGVVSQFTPSIIWQFLSVAGSDECKEPEGILLHLANSLAEKSGSFSFRIPSIHMISVYHNPARMQYSGGLTEASLSKGFNTEPVYTDDTDTVTQYNSITASNRLAILTLLLEKYCHNMGTMVPASRDRFCWLASWIAGSGMPPSIVPPSPSASWTMSSTRFTLDKGVMTALASGVQFCLYNGQHDAAQHSLELLSRRAQYDVCPEVIMLTASLRDTIARSDVSPSSKPFGIHVPELSGTQDSTRPVRRSIIRHDDIQAVRRRIASNEIKEEEPDTPDTTTAVIVECGEDSDESDIHIAGFRGGKLQNTSV